MKSMMLMVVVGLMSFGALTSAQDWVRARPAGKTVLVDNAHIRLVEVVIPPGGSEPMHTHPEYIEPTNDVTARGSRWCGAGAWSASSTRAPSRRTGTIRR